MKFEENEWFRGMILVTGLVGLLLFWAVIIMPYSILLYLYLYVKTKGTMIEKPELTRQERNLLR